jgi:hypothetical protein
MTTAVMEAIVSSNIESAGYDADAETLHVKFKNGGLYKYKSVPVQLYKDFMESESKGKFFFKEIRNKFEYDNLTSINKHNKEQ